MRLRNARLQHLPIIFMLLLIIGLLTACSNGNNQSTNANNNGGNPKLAKLHFTAPNLIPSLIDRPSYGYLVVGNTGDQAITNINYQIANPQGGGSEVTLDAASSTACSIIPAKQHCTLILNIPAATGAGSFAITASTTLNNKLTASQEIANQPRSNTIGVEQTEYSKISGIDGITLYYYTTVIAGTNYVIVTGIVTSNEVGSFNSVTLVDANNHILPGQKPLSGNLGNGLSNLSQGSTFAILLPTPGSGTGSSNQTIKLQTAVTSATGASSNIQTGSHVGNLQIVTNQAIVALLPAFVILSADKPTQTVTLANIGNTPADLSSIFSTSDNVEITPQPDKAKLTANSTITVNLSLINLTGTAATSNAILNYNNNIANKTAQITVYQDLHHTGPGPVAGLTAALKPAHTPFTTNTIAGTVSEQLIITNTGNTDESQILVRGLPRNFNLSAGTSANPCHISANRISNTLTPSGISQSCSLTLTYTNTTVTPLKNGNLSISYTYNGGQVAVPTTISFNYETVQATANLALSPATANLGTIVNNNTASASQIFTLSNNGDALASNITLTLIGANASLFKINATLPGINTPCGTSLAAGNTCQIGVQFGPSSADAFANAIAELQIIYTPYSNATNTSSTSLATLTGNLITAQSANISTNPESAIATGFTTGSGTLSAPYQIQLANNADSSITYSFSNTGKVAATGLYLDVANLPSSWAMVSNNCGSLSNKVNLTPHATCSVTVGFKPTVAGYNDLNLAGITAKYTDQAHPDGISQALTGTTYVHVYKPLEITITTLPTAPINLTQGENLNITATLSGGYANDPVQNIELAPTVPATNNITYLNNPCSISSRTPSCNITVQAGSLTTPGNYTAAITNTTSGGPTPSLPRVSFNILAKLIHAYVSDYNYLWECPINSSGEFSRNCTILNNPTGLKFNHNLMSTTFGSFTGRTYAYVANLDDKLWQCQMNADGGFDGGCKALTNSTRPGFNSIANTTFKAFDGITYAYVGDEGIALWRCPMSSNGELDGGCNSLYNSNESGFYAVFAVNFKSFNGTTYGYVSDASNTLWQCPMTSNGEFASTCIPLTNSTGPGFNAITNITFASFAGTTYAFISDFSNSLWQCPMNASGGFNGGCTALTNLAEPGGFINSSSTWLQSFNGITYAYVSDTGNQLWRCPMSPSGAVNQKCTALTNSTRPGFYMINSTSLY